MVGFDNEKQKEKHCKSINHKSREEGRPFLKMSNHAEKLIILEKEDILKMAGDSH